jgi:hypothetical protein
MFGGKSGTRTGISDILPIIISPIHVLYLTSLHNLGPQG